MNFQFQLIVCCPILQLHGSDGFHDFRRFDPTFSDSPRVFCKILSFRRYTCLEASQNLQRLKYAFKSLFQNPNRSLFDLNT